MPSKVELEYAGFWMRCIALAVDFFLLSFIVASIVPIIFSIYSYIYDVNYNDVFFSMYTIFYNMDRHAHIDYRWYFDLFFPVFFKFSIFKSLAFNILANLALILFWTYKQATPGKMLISARIVDASTGNKPSIKQLLIRLLMYNLSFIFFIPVFAWIAFDGRKQGLHDKTAGTIVIRKKDRRRAKKVQFANQI